MSVQEVIDAFNRTGVSEVVKHVEGECRLHITHRVRPKQLSVWLAILSYVLSHKDGWEVHSCKQYFLSDGGIKYAWNFIVQWASVENTSRVYQQISQLFAQANQQAPKLAHRIDSYPLMGVKESRNAPEGPLNFKASGYRQRGAHKM